VFNPDPALLAPSVRPSPDEHPPVIGPNLADNAELCREVAEYVTTEFWYPYWLQQQRLYPLWDRVDSSWRGTVYKGDLDVGITQRGSGDEENKRQSGGFGMTSTTLDPTRAKVSPAAAHKQMDAIINLGEALSFENGDLPVQARKPKTVYEHPLYNPTQQAVDAANEEIRRQADEIDLKRKHRIAFGTFVKYGHAFALRDFQRILETIECPHTLPADPQQALVLLVQLRQYYGYPERELTRDQFGRPCAIFLKTVPKILRTNYLPLDCSAVFIDELLPCAPMERQPCPIVRTHITKWELWENGYDPIGNPFGWVNIDKATRDSIHQYALSQPDEQELRNRLQKNWGLNSLPGSQRPENTIQQLWTAYPLLAIDGGKLYRDGTKSCPACNGSGSVSVEGFDADGFATSMQEKCPECQGTGKVVVKAERYVVQMFGSMYAGGGVTVLRIQRNPTAKDKVPILYAAHLVEDTSSARPVSKSQVALSAYEQLATGHNQFLDSKSRTINRPWMVRSDSLAWNINLNQANQKIPIESSMDNEVRRVESNQYDETATLIPYIQMMENEVKDIFGANDTVIGEISAGRRPASEITLADEGSKRPLVQMIDQFNAGHMGGWGQAVIDDLETWQDRDWMQQRTHSTTFGKMELFTAVGEELLKTQAAIAQYRYLLEMGATNPVMQPVLPRVLGLMLQSMGLPISQDEIDQGFKRSQQEAFRILTQILGEGVLLPPSPDDPHEIYLGAFTEAYREATTNPRNYWAQNAPQNLPLLLQRIEMQQQLLQQQQMMQRIQMIQDAQFQQALQPQQQPDPRGNQPERPGKPEKTPGQQKQAEQGANAQ
jgi:hypothetical protein